MKDDVEAKRAYNSLHKPCSRCKRDIFITEQHMAEYSADGNFNYICQDCYTDDSVPRILEDPESMKALKLLQGKGYSIDKICMMLEKYDFA